MPCAPRLHRCHRLPPRRFSPAIRRSPVSACVRTAVPSAVRPAVLAVRPTSIVTSIQAAIAIRARIRGAIQACARFTVAELVHRLVDVEARSEMDAEHQQSKDC